MVAPFIKRRYERLRAAPEAVEVPAPPVVEEPVKIAPLPKKKVLKKALKKAARKE